MQAITVIPTYNERENLPVVIERIRAAVPEMHILIVDDNSPDGTGRLADDIAATCDNVFVLHREAKAGLGKAYAAGFRYALARGYDVVAQMDADLSHDPAYLPRLLAAVQGSDLVLGSRYANGVNVVGWDFQRLLISKFASLFVRMVTGLPVTDATGGFKCWRSRALASVDLDKVFSSGYVFQVETTYRAYQNGSTIREEPIIFYERAKGGSKFNWGIVLEAVLGVLRLRLQTLASSPLHRNPKRPLTSTHSVLREQPMLRRGQ